MEKYLIILGLSTFRNYTAKEIKEAWKKICLEVHPDKGGNEEKFKEVTHAYNMLTNPSYRNEYRDVEKINLNMRLNVPISFDEGFFGTTLLLHYNQGLMSKDGKLLKEKMYLCNTHTLVIPPATCNPCEFVLKGKGLRREDSEDVGDAFVSVTPTKHRRFVLQGLDVHAVETVSLDKILKGTFLEIETMYGMDTVKIPPGTAPGSHFVIPMKGAMKLGSHIITVNPVFPSKEELKHKTEWKDLNIVWED